MNKKVDESKRDFLKKSGKLAYTAPVLSVVPIQFDYCFTSDPNKPKPPGCPPTPNDPTATPRFWGLSNKKKDNIV